MIDIINKQVEELRMISKGNKKEPMVAEQSKASMMQLEAHLRSSMKMVAKKFANKVHEKRLLSDKYGFSEGFLHELDNDIQEYISSLTEGE